MIFTSLGLLVVAAGFLIAGIAKSSVALLTLSLVITVAAGAVLILVTAAAKRLPAAAPAAAAPAGAPVLAAAPAGGMPGQPMVMYVPMQAAPMHATTVLPTVAPDGNGNGAPPPVVGYETMTAVQVTRLVGSGALTQDQLLSLRDYEQTNAARKTVLASLESQLG